MNLRRLLGVTTFALACGSSAEAGFFDRFKGDDGWLDTSDWVLENPAGFPTGTCSRRRAAPLDEGFGYGAEALFLQQPVSFRWWD